MITGLNEYEVYKVIRPVIGKCNTDLNHYPIIRKPSFDTIDWEELYPVNYQNLSPMQDNSNALVLMFRYDKYLLALWNNPLKRIPLFQNCMAIGTPDFSIYSTMNPNEIRHNVYQSRWLGCTWQNYGCTVFPTIGWADKSTYDICFGGVEEGCPVIVSTLGCQEKADVFLSGFNEMKHRIKPPVIIVYGDMIKGMTGTFIQFKYEDAFSKKGVQMRMKAISQIFTIKEVG